MSKDFSLSDFDTFKKELLEELRNAKYHDLKVLVFRMELTFDEIIDIIIIKCFRSKRTVYTISPGTNETSDFNKTLKYLLFKLVKISITIDGFRLGSILSIIRT